MAGSFTLAFGSQTTQPLPFDASPVQVRGALGQLYGLPDVSVTRTTRAAQFGFSWTVTFTQSVGNQPLLLAHFAPDPTGGTGL